MIIYMDNSLLNCSLQCLTMLLIQMEILKETTLNQENILISKSYKNFISKDINVILFKSL